MYKSRYKWFNCTTLLAFSFFLERQPKICKALITRGIWIEMHCSSDIHSGGEGQIIKYKYPVKGAYTAASACPCILTPVITGLWAIVAIKVSLRDDLPQFFRYFFFFFYLFAVGKRRRLEWGRTGAAVQDKHRNTRRSARRFPSVNSRDQSAMPRRLFLFAASPNYTWQAAGKWLDGCTKLSSTCN